MPSSRSNRPMRALTIKLGLVILALCLVPVTASAQKPKKKREAFLVDRVVAVVNDAILMASELDVRLLPMLGDVEEIEDPDERRRRLEKLRSQMLEDMIDEELIVQAAEEARIELEPNDVDVALEEIKKTNKLDDKQFAAALTQQGYTLSAYKNDIRRQLTRLKAVNQLVRAKVKISDEDVRARYDAMVRRSESVSAVQLSHILIRVPEKATDAELAAAKEAASAALLRVQNGEAFGVVANEVSQDEKTNKSEGALGWIERGGLRSEWEAVVFSMEKGEVRGPISGTEGLHVFYVSDIKRTEIKSYDDLKESIRGELTRREMEKQTDVWIAELRKNAYIDNKL